MDLISLGIDTGGTYTDAVFYCPQKGVLGCAKAPTTRHDLSVGIGNAVRQLMADTGIAARSIGLVSMSTTLATNALVEKQGGRVAFIGIGFERNDFTKNEFAAILGNDPLILINGGHDAFGRAKPLDLARLEAALAQLDDGITAIGVASLFAVRNPEHEIAVKERIAQFSTVPVTMSHELSSKLGGPKRALTTLLNARLVGMIDRLISSTRAFFHSCEIGAPLMVVRGDGSLVSAEFAALKPIETILSGPAASLVGAHFLTKIDNALVCDVGGTTTDIGLLHNGRARLTVEGAVVGGLNTSVEGVSMHTYGLGSDSDICLSETLTPSLTFGPRRIVPLSLVDPSQIEHVAQVLRTQIAQDVPHRVEGRFVQRTGLEESLYTKITMQFAPLTDVISSASELSALERLIGRGLVFICGFTPTDAQHILGRQTNGNRYLAELGGILFARKRDGYGRAIRSSEIDLAHWVVSQLENRSVEFILQTAFYEDGLDGETLVRSPLLQKALTDSSGIAQLNVTLDRPIIALGASAQLIYPNVGQKLKSQIIVPDYAHVANAIGAVVGEVCFKVVADIQKHRDQFIVLVGETRTIFESEQAAVDHACATASHYACDRAQQVGATHPYVAVEKEIKMVEIEGVPTFISAQIWATAHGRPNMSV